jgi:RNA polymerase sigma factor (sigma-70 family)
VSNSCQHRSGYSSRAVYWTSVPRIVKHSGDGAAHPDFEEVYLQASFTKTSATLLSEVRDSGNEEAWSTFESRYREMLLRFCQSLGVQHADSEDIIQAVFSKLLSGLKNFEYDPARGRFRDYLFRCVRSGMSDWAARPKPAGWSVVPHEGASLADSQAASELLEQEWMNHHYRMALACVRLRADPNSVAVLEATIAGSTVPDIARSMTMTEQAVYKVQQRMRNYLKEEIATQVREEDNAHG